jgi:hypothetical protein
MDRMIGKYSKRGLFSLFLSCAFLLHIWSLVLIFKDFSMLIVRTSLWGAFGVLSYGLVFAFIESAFVFLIVLVLGFLISSKWDEAHRIALLSILVMIATLWEIYGQAGSIWNFQVPPQIIWLIFHSQHPLRFLVLFVGAAFAGIVLTFLVPAFLILRSKGFFNFIQSMLERVGFLTEVYLVLDILALLVVVIRNI